MPKKIKVPVSRLSKPTKTPTKKLSAWNKYAEERIEAARKSTRITDKDMKIIVNT